MLISPPSDLLAGAIPTVPARRTRDPRLDFFRGLGLFIILIAHIPGNVWTLWIPARFGFSDATEMFVFQSGMASAIAFGATFDRAGPWMLVARVTRRIWQIYWTHICVFVLIVALLVAAGARPDGMGYATALNLDRFLGDPGGLLGGLLTLTYVPNYFDVLPMYIVILALMPVMLIAARIHPGLVFALMAGLWLAAGRGLALPAEPFSERPWFFNPFGWQLLFFTGFFLARGQIPAPPFHPLLAAGACLFLATSVPFALVRWYDMHPTFEAAARAIAPLTDKTAFGLLRYAHFLCLAYLAAHALGPGGAALRGPVVRVVSVVGQQSLAVFAAGMAIAQILGIALDRTGGGGVATAAVNVAGFAGLIAVAHVARWFKADPWARRKT